VSGTVLGNGTYKLRGDPNAPQSVKLNKVICQKNTLCTIEGFEFTGPTGVDVRSRAQVILRSARFSGNQSAIDIRDAFLDCNYTNLRFANSVQTIATMYNYSNLSPFGTNFELDANMDWGASGAFFMQSFCLAWLQASQFSGQAGSAVGRRYNISISSVLNTAGQTASFIPGTAAGVANSGAQYV
jgi:hypothetical protein